MYGRCPKCGGRTHKQWGGVSPQYYCAKCGVILSNPGKKKYISEKEIVKEMIRVWDILGLKEVQAVPFIDTVRKNLGVPRLSVSKYLIYQSGFDIGKGKIWRRLE